jgi:predicted aspartyl protease
VNTVLIGVVTLEILGLEVDLVMGELKEAKIYLL